MSTVMYCYWLEKSQLYTVADKIRKFLEDNAFIFQLDKSDYREWREVAIEYKEDYESTMQLFEIMPDRYLVRFITPFYLIENNVHLFELEPCFYDNRSDMLDTERENEKYAEIVDTLIISRRYLILPLIDQQYVLDWAWNKSYDHKN